MGMEKVFQRLIAKSPQRTEDSRDCAKVMGISTSHKKRSVIGGIWLDFIRTQFRGEMTGRSVRKRQPGIFLDLFVFVANNRGFRRVWETEQLFPSLFSS